MSSLFGGNNAAPPGNPSMSSSSPGSGAGTAGGPNQPPSRGLFGTTSNNANTNTAGGLFGVGSGTGATGTSGQSFAAGHFGTTSNNANANTTCDLFGAGSRAGTAGGSAQSPNPGLFGTTSNNATPNASTNATGGLFGGTSKPASSGLFAHNAAGQPSQSSKVALDELTSSLARLFARGSYSDLTITCGSDEYKVHRAIICPRSTFFEAACNSAFKEAQTGEINLPDDDPHAVKMMIHYFYHLDYPSVRPINSPLPGNKQLSSLSLHARVYALAEKYDVKALKAMAKEKFEADAVDHWESDDFLIAIREVYTSTVEDDRSLRDVVVRTISQHPTLLERKQVQDVVKSLDLAFDLLMHSRKWGLSRW